MSRRKQDKPQQLKIPMAVPAAGEDGEELMEGDEPPSHCDLLQCGDCESTFILSDIVKFIAHKRKCWKKEKEMVVPKTEPNKPEDDSQPVEAGDAKEKEEEEMEKEEKEGVAVAMTTSATTTMSSLEAILRAEKPKIITPIKRTSSLSQSRDAPSPRAKETQTDSIPDSHAAEKYICVSCKGLFEHAATLLKHAQEDHGMQIYTFPKEERPFSRSRSVSVESVSQADSLSPKSTTSNTVTGKQLIPKPVESSLPQIIHSPLAPLPVHSPHSHPVDGHTPPFPVLIRPTVPDRLYSTGIYPHISQMHRREYHPIHPHESRITELPPHISPVSIADFHPSQMPFPPPPPPPLPPPHLQPQSQPQHQSSTESSAASHLKRLANKSPPLSPHRRLPYPGYQTRRYPPFSGKGKSCEFCGKSFKFQSNLVVHRRSHTGEKPFKCHLCDHACSQASKLKRHMKTHMNKPPSAMGSAPDDKDDNSMEDEGPEGSMGMRDGKSMSDSSSPDEEEMEEEEEEEEDEDEKEEGEEGEEEPDEADMVDVKPRVPGKDDEEETGKKSNSEAKSSEQECDEDEKIKERRPSSSEMESLKSISRISPKGHHPSSLLSEMMANSGLDEIQQYNEAFKQAIAERNVIYGKPRPSSNVSSPENSHPRNANSRPPSIPHDQPSPIEASLMARLRAEHSLVQANHPLTHGMVERSAMSDLELVTNRIKVEPSTSWPPSPLAMHNTPLISSPVRSEASPLGTPNGSSTAAFFAPRRFMDSNGAMSSSAILPYNSPPNRIKPHRSTDKRCDTCEFCGKQFKNCSNLTVHRRSHTGEKPYKCQLCSYACAQSSKLTRHMKTHGHGAKEVFKCEVCNMPFSVYSTLEKHMKKEHWGAIKGLAPRTDAVGSRVYSYKANLPGLSK